MTARVRGNSKSGPEWRLSLALAVVVVYLHFLLEWLFFATKPSFLSALSWMERLYILWLSPLALVALLLALGIVLYLVGLLAHSLNWLGLVVMRAAAALVASVSALLLVDNFTLTVWSFGIRDTARLSAVPYLVLFGVFVVVVWRQLGRIRAKRRQGVVYLAALLLGSSLAFLVMSSRGGVLPAQAEWAGAPQGLTVGPNIVFLSSDGLAAASLSAYGFEKDTTPFLRTLSPELLFCENAFSNVSSTGGSLTSLLTGKLPTETRVIYPPDILRGKDAFEHLPAILRSRGYRTWHYSIRHYADPFDLNFQESFDSSNSQSREGARVLAPTVRLLGTETAYFLGQTWDRVESRVLHLARIRAIPDVFEEVTQPRALTPRDEESVKKLIDFLQSSSQPFFAQLHLMGTHGPRFRPPKRVFSKGQEQDSPWMQDFYLDAVLAFDSSLRKIVAALREKELLERTILVIHTDHARQFQTGVRIPLMFRFPRAQYSGHIQSNTQLLDVAPTVLDFIGVRPPGWMSGRSLISTDLDPLEPIVIATQRAKAAVKRGRVYEIDPERAGPPFFSLGRIRTVICDTLFTLDLDSLQSSMAKVEGHTAPCPKATIPSPAHVQGFLISHLAAQGYDVASIDWSHSHPATLFSQIESFAEGLQRQGKSLEEVQRLTWEVWGDEIVRLFNASAAEPERIPSWLELAIKWAESRSEIEIVRPASGESGKTEIRAVRKK